jgi:hypothetical protein
VVAVAGKKPGRGPRLQFIFPPMPWGPPHPEYIDLVAADLEQLRADWKSGDGAALLWAIYTYLVFPYVRPVWAIDGFTKCLLEWRASRGASLDQAFGIRKRGKHRARHDALRHWIVFRVAELHFGPSQLPIVDDLFGRLADELVEACVVDRIDGATVRKLYYSPPCRKLRASFGLLA